MCCLLIVFFFKQKTAYEMRISDWSSDVCSSDLVAVSLVPPQETNDVRRSFCCHVHFFASTHVAQDWASKRPGLTIIGVREAFCVGQELNRQLLHPPHRATP